MSSTNLESKVCKNNGCKKKYSESENNNDACCFHPGLPIFHDCKKGWTCCQVIVYDWDEFQKIKGCQVGPHVPKDLNQVKPNDQSEFFQSKTVTDAQQSLVNVESEVKPVVKSIDEFNSTQKEIQESKTEIPKSIIITASGKYKCSNKGCNKEYTEEENIESSCSFHSGQPIFHDLKKYWSCCKKETWDWDEFVKLPTCQTGKHVPKYK